MTFNQSDVEQIEVVRGPASATWGANAMTGAVNILTREPRRSVGTDVTLWGGVHDRNAGSTADLGAGTIYGTNASVTRAPSADVAYRISAGHYRSDGYPRPAGRVAEADDPRVAGRRVGGAVFPDLVHPAASQTKLDARLDHRVHGGRGRLSYSGGLATPQGTTHTALGPFDLREGYRGYAKLNYERDALSVQVFANLLDGVAPSLLFPDARLRRIAVTTCACVAGSVAHRPSASLPSAGATNAHASSSQSQVRRSVAIRTIPLRPVRLWRSPAQRFPLLAVRPPPVRLVLAVLARRLVLARRRGVIPAAFGQCMFRRPRRLPDSHHRRRRLRRDHPGLVGQHCRSRLDVRDREHYCALCYPDILADGRGVAHACVVFDQRSRADLRVVADPGSGAYDGVAPDVGAGSDLGVRAYLRCRSHDPIGDLAGRLEAVGRAQQLHRRRVVVQVAVERAVRHSVIQTGVEDATP